MRAERFPNWAEKPSNCLLKNPQKIRADDRNVRLSIGIIPVSLNPEEGRAGLLVGQPLRLGKPSHDSQQRSDAAALLVVGIGDNSGRHFIAGECAAHRDCPNRGKPAVDHGEQFESGHTGHVEIG